MVATSTALSAGFFRIFFVIMFVFYRITNVNVFFSRELHKSARFFKNQQIIKLGINFSKKQKDTKLYIKHFKQYTTTAVLIFISYAWNSRNFYVILHSIQNI